MKNYYVSCTLANGNVENIVVEAATAKDIMKKVTNSEWLVNEENDVIQAVNPHNVAVVKISEMDENGPTVGTITF